MSYGVVINYGSGDVNLRSYSGQDLVLQKGFSKTQTLYNKDFKPTIDTAKFSILLNSTLSAALFALDNDALVTVTITKDGSGWFKGYIRPVTGVTVNAGGGDTMDFECVDVGWSLHERPTGYAQKSVDDSMVVFDGTSTSNSIVHWILSEAGFTGTVNGTDIDESIDYMRLYSTDYFETLTEVLYAHHHTFYFDGDGNFHIYNWGPSSVSSSGTLDEDDAIRTLKINRRDEDTNKVEVKTYELNVKEGAILASKTYDKIGLRFERSYTTTGTLVFDIDPESTRTEWAADPYWAYFINKRRKYDVTAWEGYGYVKLWVTEDSTHYAADYLGVTASTDGRSYTIKIDVDTMPVSQVNVSVSKVLIKGDRVNVNEGVIKSAGSGGNIKAIDSKYCYSESWGAELAQAILVNLQTGTWEYSWKSTDSLDLGAIYTIENSSANISQTTRIIEKKVSIKSGNIFYEYKSRGVGPIGTVVDTTAAGTQPQTVTLAELAAAAAGVDSSELGGETPPEVVGNSLPASDDSPPQTEGLYVFSDKLGYVDGSGVFKSYFGSDGKFKFTGSGSNVIEFDGTDLTVNADVALNGTVTTGDAIQSDNYNAGVAGWQIDGDGDAEFNSLTIRDEVFEAVMTSYTSGIAVGFDGTGSLASPDEGDRRVLIDNDEVTVQEYLDSSWTGHDSIKIGGSESNIFTPYYQGGGACVPQTGLDDYADPPPTWLHTLKLDGSTKSLDGTITTSITSPTTYSATQTKYNAASLFSIYGDSGRESVSDLESVNLGTGYNFGIGGWFYVDTLPTTTDELLGVYQNEYASNGFIRLSLQTNGKFGVSIGSSTTIQFSSTTTATAGAWYFVVTYYFDGALYLGVNNDLDSTTPTGMSVYVNGAGSVYFYGPNRANAVIYTSDGFYIDNGLDYDPWDTFYKYYSHGRQWSRGVYDNAFSIVGNLSISGNTFGAALPPGFIYGLSTEAASDSDHDVLINPGECRDYSNQYNLKTSKIIKQIDATWAVGSNTGGLFTGTVAADTTYHLFLIRKDSDGSIDAGWDTDIDCANIPSGYTAYRRIWSHITDTSANILNYIQSGNEALFADPIDDYNGSLSSATPTTYTLTVPSIATHANLGVTIYENNSSYSRASVVLLHPSQNTYTPASPNVPARSGDISTYTATSTDETAGASRIRQLISNSQVVAVSYLALDTFKILTHGYTDDRGQHGGK